MCSANGTVDGRQNELDVAELGESEPTRRRTLRARMPAPRSVKDSYGARRLVATSTQPAFRAR
jgi:hypothetical protein